MQIERKKVLILEGSWNEMSRFTKKWRPDPFKATLHTRSIIFATLVLQLRPTSFLLPLYLFSLVYFIFSQSQASFAGFGEICIASPIFFLFWAKICGYSMDLGIFFLILRRRGWYPLHENHTFKLSKIGCFIY